MISDKTAYNDQKLLISMLSTNALKESSILEGHATGISEFSNSRSKKL